MSMRIAVNKITYRHLQYLHSRPRPLTVPHQFLPFLLKSEEIETGIEIPTQFEAKVKVQAEFS